MEKTLNDALAGWLLILGFWFGHELNPVKEYTPNWAVANEDIINSKNDNNMPRPFSQIVSQVKIVLINWYRL
jgi:hypothetical protein